MRLATWNLLHGRSLSDGQVVASRLADGARTLAADVVGLRALGERDVLLGTDLAVRRQLEARGITATDAWAPFRSYATVHLWRPYV